MDKSIMKILFAGRGLPVCRSHDFVRPEWDRNRNALLQQIGALGLPVFVKPANLGSSVGITKVKTQAELVPAIELALQFDRKIIVEAAVPRAREIECAVLGNDDPKTSVPGEILPSREFYDYEAKYLDEGSKTVIPADLPQATVAEVQRLAIEAFRAIDGAGLARVDFLMDGDTGTIYLNEINTLPGFTNISMYSKMWEASGVGYSALVDRLIQLASSATPKSRSSRRALCKFWCLFAFCLCLPSAFCPCRSPSAAPASPRRRRWRAATT